jgi:hypothetical protein
MKNGRAVMYGKNDGKRDNGLPRGITMIEILKSMYAFFFSQQGLMAGLGLQGIKITKITK